MDNTGAGRYNLEVVESLGAPLEELESLAVTLELELFIFFGGTGNTSGIDLHRVINDQVDWHEGVNLGRVTSKALHSVTHGSEIHNSWYTSEVLQDDSGGAEGNLSIVLRRLLPVEDGFDVLLLDGEVVAVTDGTLEKDAD